MFLIPLSTRGPITLPRNSNVLGASRTALNVWPVESECLVSNVFFIQPVRVVNLRLPLRPAAESPRLGKVERARTFNWLNSELLYFK